MEGTTAERLQSILDSKAAIKDAIEAKGQIVGTAPLSGYAEKILNIQTGSAGEMLNVTLDTNQINKSDLIGAIVTVTYSETGETDSQTWEGNVLSFEIPPYVNYAVSVSSINGYSQPSAQNYVALTGNVRVVTMYLNSEWATITCATEDGENSTVGQIITVYGNEYTYSAPFMVKIPIGEEYTVTANAKDGYDAVIPQTFTASQVSRNITVEYPTIKIGIYILHTNGKLVSRSNWNTANNASAVGVAVMSNNCRFCIAKEQASALLAWGGNGTTINDIATSTNSTTAKTDYLGNSNTDKIIAQLGASSALAANYCKTYIFPNGNAGYLGSLGEWQEAYNNKIEVDACMSVIGGTAITTDAYHWASTQYTSSSSWVLHWSNGDVSAGTKNRSQRVRAFAAF